jgi:hypothetical protein
MGGVGGLKLSAVRQLRGGRIAELRGKAARLADKADLVGGHRLLYTPKSNESKAI